MWNTNVKPEVVKAINGLIFTTPFGYARNHPLAYKVTKTEGCGFEMQEVRDALKSIIDGAKAEGEECGSINFGWTDSQLTLTAIPEDIEILRNYAFGGIDTGLGKVCDIGYSDPTREITKFIDRYMAGNAQGKTMSIDLLRYIPGEENKPTWLLKQEMEVLLRQNLGEASYREPHYRIKNPDSWERGSYKGKLIITIEKSPEEIRALETYQQAQFIKDTQIEKKASAGYFHVSVPKVDGESHKKALQAVESNISKKFAEQVFGMKATLCNNEEVITLRTKKGSDAEKFFTDRAKLTAQTASLSR